jgi:hypothetical protein
MIFSPLKGIEEFYFTGSPVQVCDSAILELDPRQPAPKAMVHQRGGSVIAFYRVPPFGAAEETPFRA